MATSASSSRKQISYIAPAAPARRRAAPQDVPPVRPEFGFTPAWYAHHLAIDFGERWHREPAYRRQTILSMRRFLKKEFPGCNIGGCEEPDQPLDLLTGVYGGCIVPALYGLTVTFDSNQWPNCRPDFKTLDDLVQQGPLAVADTPLLQDLLAQMEWIAAEEGAITGHLNWQGILNNGQRLLGPELFVQMLTEPERCRSGFSHIYQTMVDASALIQQRQRQSGFDTDFFTVSNCSVNMLSPATYEQMLLPFDEKFAAGVSSLAIHNCAWKADPYLPAYARIDNVGYIDMGIETDLRLAKTLFPQARRALMYTPMDFHNKPVAAIKADLAIVVEELAPCDIVFADLDLGVENSKIREICAWCRAISDRKS